MPNTAKLILASTSPRRRELVTLFDAAFECTSVETDESPRAGESPDALVRRLSRAKADLGAHNFPTTIVVGADTIGWIDDAIISKPSDASDAVRMLKQLRARPHIVYSGVTVRHNARVLTLIATTTVWMRDYSDAEIAAYVATGDPLDKAAAYAIQHGDFRPVAQIDGCHANVMGLPLCHLYRALTAFGVNISAPDLACQKHLNIVCPVAQPILETPIENLKSEIEN